MSRRRHGKRRGIAFGVCDVKSVAFTTYEAAASAAARVKDAERVYRGKCCGYYHITRLTIDEYAQRCAIPEEAGHGTEPGVRQGDAGTAAVERGGVARLAPSPAEVARRLQARGDS